MLQVLILVFGIMMVRWQNKLDSTPEQDKAVITELTDDWAVVPFVSIRVSDTECEADEEAAFVREWGGTLEGCLYPVADLTERGSLKTVLATREEYDDFIRRLNSDRNSKNGRGPVNIPCTRVPPTMPV